MTKRLAFTSTKIKYRWELFAKESKNFKLEEAPSNINMRNHHRSGIDSLHLQVQVALSFSCEIMIKPRSKEY